MKIPFYRIHTLNEGAENINFLTANPEEISKRNFTANCQSYFESMYPGYRALLVSSCTRALDLIAMSLNLGPEDEIIMPSFNYIGVANAFAITGAKLVFTDVNPRTMTMDIESLNLCISDRTKAVVVMNYGGLSESMFEIRALCDKNNLMLIEDNAQGIGAFLKDKRFGSFGDFSCISFDSLKNISCGEGGVVLFKSQYEAYIQTIFNNGTNRVAFEKGEVKAYEWVALGSKFAISEFSAAVLYPLLLNEELITLERRQKWQMLYDGLFKIDAIRPYLPQIMSTSKHNAHIFYLLFDSRMQRDTVMNSLQTVGVECSFHYTPLHSSIFGKGQNYKMIKDDYTSLKSDCLLRLPMFNALSKDQIGHICAVVAKSFEKVEAEV
jgi:dTDP-4-amino-4,6-dideoxygalactose transaminase